MFLLALATGCHQAEAKQRSSREAVQPQEELLGTFRGTVNGTGFTWFALVGEIEEERRPSAFWTVLGGERLASLGGYDTKNVPFETFASDPSTGAMDYGTYRGSVISIAFPFSADDSDLTFRFPAGDDRSTSTMVAYVAEGERVEDPRDLFARMYHLREGTLTVSVSQVDEGRAVTSEGTFSGRFVRMTGEGSVRIEDGGFEIQRVPRFEILGESGAEDRSGHRP